MHLCYLDESGEGSPFVLAGSSAFERDTYSLAKELNDLASRLFPTRTSPWSSMLQSSARSTNRTHSRHCWR